MYSPLAGKALFVGIADTELKQTLRCNGFRRVQGQFVRLRRTARVKLSSKQNHEGLKFLSQAKLALKFFCCSENNEVFKGDFSFFVIKKRSPPLTPKRKNILLAVVHSHFIFCTKSYGYKTLY